MALTFTFAKRIRIFSFQKVRTCFKVLAALPVRIKPVKIVFLSAMIKCFSEKLSDTRSLKMVERIRSLFLCHSQVFKSYLVDFTMY